MNETMINLCEILKGHEGEIFYCSGLQENVTLKSIGNDYITFTDFDGIEYDLLYHGGKWFNKPCECMFWPSENSRDWNKWIEENKPKIPKTWSDTQFNSSFIVYELSYIDNDKDNVLTSTGISPIERSALALLKIHQLIEVGYGGNVTMSDYIDIHKKAWGINYDFLRNNFYPSTICYSLVAFHTEEQAKEFLSYPENIQLLKDYYMI